MSIRSFKLWNADRTSSFDFNQTGITVIEPKGLGNKFSNTIQSGNRSRNYLTDQKNDFDDISLKVLFGLKGNNAYSLYNQLSVFIQSNGRNQMILEYSRNDETLYVDVIIKQVTKTEKTQFNILEETITFERVSPLYKFMNITSNLILIQNNYFENILPKLSLKKYSRNNPINIKVSSKNIANTNYRGMSYSGYGITIEIHEFNNKIRIKINGTTTAAISSTLDKLKMNNLSFNDHKYTFSINKISGSFTGEMQPIINYTGGTSKVLLTLSGTTIQETEHVQFDGIEDTGKFDFYFSSGMIINNLIIEIQIEKTNTNNIPIEELNGHTLNEIFGSMGDKSEITSNGVTYSYDANLNYFYLNGTSTAHIYPQIQYYGSTTNNSNWYINLKFISGITDKTVFQFGNAPLYNMNTNLYSDEIYGPTERSYKYENINSFIHYYTDLNVNFTMDNVILRILLINMSDFGIDDLSIEKMDYYYNLYLQNNPTDYSKPSIYEQLISVEEALLITDEFIVDSEFKNVIKNGDNAYDSIDKSNDTFIVIPPGDFIIESEDGQPIQLEWKQWVID
ncbi:MAG: phage distal tail protein domain-containing protein [Acholeplasmataceae bacterium]